MYVYLFDKRSMSLLGVVSAAAGLLLFSGGILLGLYFNLPAADPSPRAALIEPAGGSGAPAHGGPGGRGSRAGGSGDGGGTASRGAGGGDGSAGGGAGDDGGTGAGTGPAAGGGAASSGGTTSGGTATQGGAGTGGEAAPDGGSAPEAGSTSGGGSAPDGSGGSGDPIAGGGAADDGTVPSVAYRGWARDRSAAALPPPATAAPPRAPERVRPPVRRDEPRGAYDRHARAALAPPAAAPAAPAAAPATPAAAVHAVFTVQVGAYSVEDNARREVSTLEAAGYRPQVVMVTTGSGRPLHAVLLGTYPDRGEAAAEAARFTSREGRPVWVRQIDAR